MLADTKVWRSHVPDSRHALVEATDRMPQWPTKSFIWAFISIQALKWPCHLGRGAANAPQLMYQTASG
eukprot:10781080-Alexandrium_andersonii.AAC.1